jgi:hypothetical protein
MALLTMTRSTLSPSPAQKKGAANHRCEVKPFGMTPFPAPSLSALRLRDIIPFWKDRPITLLCK